MPTHAKGPLQRDYLRALRAAKEVGAKFVRLEMSAGVTIVVPLDDAQIEKIAVHAARRASLKLTEDEQRKYDLVI